MAYLVAEETLSRAWVAAMEHLLRGEGKAVNLAVAFQQGVREQSVIRTCVDRLLEACGLPEVQTVANTIFPDGLYLPEKLGDRARQHVYDNYQEFYDGIGRRCAGNARGTYFYRMMAWNAAKGHPTNQLETLIGQLRAELSHTRPGPKSSRYEIAVVDPSDVAPPVGSDLRIFSPEHDQRLLMGFPCLSHISLTYAEGKLHLTALYRNQSFVEKAYGNYLGLARLLRFLCLEVGRSCQPGEVLCIASHADGQLNLGRNRLRKVIDTCQEALKVDGLEVRAS